MSEFGADEIRLGEALYRAEAHLSAACLLYGAGRKPDALLQSARPITDILPWLETEVRAVDDALREFFGVTSYVGALIRRNEKPRSLRKVMTRVEQARATLLENLIGPERVEDRAYLASVAVALLETACEAYRKGVESESLGDYQSAFAIAGTATDVLAQTGAKDHASMPTLLASLDATLPAVEPPERLVRPSDVRTLVDDIATAAGENLGAVRITWTLDDALAKVDRMLGDVVAAYEKGLGPLAARLAATLFVRAYDPVRRELGAEDADRETLLTGLLGFELRRAINDGAPLEDVRSIAARAHAVLRPG